MDLLNKKNNELKKNNYLCSFSEKDNKILCSDNIKRSNNKNNYDKIGNKNEIIDKLPEFKINNVVATVKFDSDKKIDLKKIADSNPDIEFFPKRFPGLTIRINDPKGTANVFSSNKMTIVGIKKTSSVKKVLQKVVKKIKNADIEIINPKIKIENIAADGKFNKNLDLDLANVVFSEPIYEPEIFPGLVYEMEEPKNTFLIFSNGNVINTGSNNEKNIKEGFKKLFKEFEDFGLIIEDQD